MYLELSPEELRTRGGVLDKIMDTAFDASILIDRNGRIIHNSEGSVRLLKMPREELIGRHISIADPASPFDRVIRTGRAEFGVVVVIKGRKCLTNLLPVVWKGEVIGVLGMVLFRSMNQLKKILASLSEEGKADQIYDVVARVDSNYTFDDFIGESRVVKEMLEQCRRAALTPYPVLITGETGTGKEILASAIHSENLNNSFAPFIKINCTAIPHDLLESELFGYEKGAFTGAVTAKKGKFELASGGSILLDEIGDMDPRLQSKLLRVIEEKEFERIGGTRLLPLNARIIASTNGNLKELCRQGKFRLDLYYRLSTVEIKIPPLRARREDIPLLVKHFLEKENMELLFSRDALDVLMRYDWPGNVRELRNVINRLVIMNLRRTVTADDVRLVLKNGGAPAAGGEPAGGASGERAVWSAGEGSLQAAEREVILGALERCNFNISAAARQLGISRATLYSKIRKNRIVLRKGALLEGGTPRLQ